MSSNQVTPGPDVTVIVVSFNTRDITIACLRSVLKHCLTLRLQIIVIDNASTDGSADAISREFPDVRLISAGENLGFARANNLAAQEAVGEYLLLLNPDTLLLDDAIAAVVACARRTPHAGIWGGRTLYGDRSLNPTSCWGFMSIRSIVLQMLGLSAALKRSEFFSPETYGRWQRDSEREVDIVTGCFLLISRSLWRELGGFDPRYFMYAEEADLNYRACRRGFRPRITPTATLVHLESQSDPIRVEKSIKVLRGKCTFVRLHWGPIRRWLGLTLLQVSPAVRSMAYRALGAFLRDPIKREKAQLWEEIFRRRREWLSGYPPWSPQDAERNVS